MINIVERHFSRAAAHYDNNATVQGHSSLQLFNLITQSVVMPISPSVFEVGCGTGKLTKLLSSLNPSTLLVNDICKEYAPILESKIGKGNFSYTMGDASVVTEMLALSGNKFDIIASSSAIQWIREPLQFINRCAGLLTNNGIIAFSSFLPDNLFEINALCNCTSPVTYSSEEEIRRVIGAKYNILHISYSHTELYFSSPTEVLLHLKRTGVNASLHNTERQITWTRGRMAEFERGYKERFYVEGKGYRLTYSPIYVIARKK